MRIIVRPIVDPQREIDLTQRLIAAIAEELWRLYGGNEQLNWLEAELHLQHIVGAARAAAEATSVIVVRPTADGDEMLAPVVQVRPAGVAMPRPIRNRRSRSRHFERSTARTDRRIPSAPDSSRF